MPPIPDFTEAEQRTVHVQLQRRYGTAVAIEPAGSEFLLDYCGPAIL